MNKKSIGYGFKKYYTDDALDKYDESQSNKITGNFIRSLLFCGLNVFIFTIYFIYINLADKIRIINNEEFKNKIPLINDLLQNILFYFLINNTIFILFNFLFSLEHNSNSFLGSVHKFLKHFKTHMFLFTFQIFIYLSLYSPFAFSKFYFNSFNNSNFKLVALIICNLIAIIQFLLYLFIICYTMIYTSPYKPMFFAQNFKKFFKV